MSKIIFLDVDGVLNRHHWRYGTKKKSPMGYTGIESKYIAQLKRIVDDTGAEIVLSSDWQMCFDTDECDSEKADPDGTYLVQCLKEFGLQILCKSHGKWCKNQRVTGRGGEIRLYLKLHPEVTDYVILDDIEFPDFTNELLDHFVHLEYPLTKRSADKAICILHKTD